MIHACACLCRVFAVSLPYATYCTPPPPGCARRDGLGSPVAASEGAGSNAKKRAAQPADASGGRWDSDSDDDGDGGDAFRGFFSDGGGGAIGESGFVGKKMRSGSSGGKGKEGGDGKRRKVGKFSKQPRHGLSVGGRGRTGGFVLFLFCGGGGEGGDGGVMLGFNIVLDRCYFL